MFDKELIETLKICPKVYHVHFDTKGRHYFNVYKTPDGEKYGQFYPLPGGQVTPDLSTRIVETYDREQVIANQPRNKKVEKTEVKEAGTKQSDESDDSNDSKQKKKNK